MRRKRKLTPEQAERARARRERFKAYYKQVKALSEGERERLASRVQVHSIEGRSLSVHNQCLLALQSPGCTIVGGFRQWLKAGRVVQKGESGLMIWIPRFRNKGDTPAGQAPEDTGVEGFIVGTVFDIGQTEERGAA
jgi:hypothetical protein